MDLKGKTVGFAVTGSHCTYAEVFPEIERFVQAGVRVIPIFSNSVLAVATRFGEAGEWATRIEEVTGETAIVTLPDAEPLGPSKLLDALIIAPCTGSTLSRLANAQNDSAVLMAAKATMRNDRPIIIGISTNDGLGLNAVNVARLLSTKNMFFVPFGQDDPFKKMNSLVAKMDLIMPTVEMALEKRQYQPMLIERYQYAH
ncbi:MAG: dipicolinate synthase subunit B [Acidibacillus sp.]|nr:dipicolinate synthase subunit B [Acidibacillus sp.]